MMSKNGSTVIATPGLIRCANSTGKDDSHDSFPIICNKINILGGAYDHSSMHNFSESLISSSSVQTTALSWGLSLETLLDIVIVFNEPFCYKREWEVKEKDPDAQNSESEKAVY